VILIADDDSMLRSLMVRALSPGHCVLQRVDGQGALDVARSRPIDVAVLDVQMPPPDGLEVAARLLALRDPPQIILVSGVFLDHGWDRRLRVPDGVHACVPKPFDVVELRRVVEAALAKG